MNNSSLDEHLLRERARASLVFELDEALGTHHGVCWSDFMLLQLLDDADAAVPHVAMARQLGLMRSQLLRRVLPLEKTGVVAQVTTDGGTRAVMLGAAGRRLLREARETAASVCATRAATPASVVRSSGSPPSAS